MIITNTESLRDHVSALLGNYSTDASVELICEAIETDANCPEFGEEWHEYMDKLDLPRTHVRLFQSVGVKFYSSEPVERWSTVDDLRPILVELAERGYRQRGYWKWQGDRYVLEMYLDPLETEPEGSLELFGLDDNVLVALIENSDIEEAE
jgi:hypothetical protein